MAPEFNGYTFEAIVKHGYIFWPFVHLRETDNTKNLDRKQTMKNEVLIEWQEGELYKILTRSKTNILLPYTPDKHKNLCFDV